MTMNLCLTLKLWFRKLTSRLLRSHFQSHKDSASHVWSGTSLHFCRSEPPVWHFSPVVCNFWTFWFIQVETLSAEWVALRTGKYLSLKCRERGGASVTDRDNHLPGESMSIMFSIIITDELRHHMEKSYRESGLRKVTIITLLSV